LRTRRDDGLFTVVAPADGSGIGIGDIKRGSRSKAQARRLIALPIDGLRAG
jgi:hypothetical protein